MQVQARAKTPHRTQTALFLDVQVYFPARRFCSFDAWTPSLAPPKRGWVAIRAPLIDGDFSQSVGGGLFLGGRTFGEFLLCHCLLPASLLTKLEQILLVGGIGAAVSCAPYHAVFLPGERCLDCSSRSFGSFEEA
jgi:hypothetical protein